MRTRFIAMILIAGFAVLLCTYTSRAQQSTTTSPTGSDEIIIRKKGDKDSRFTIEFKDGQVIINGKPMTEYSDDNVSISRRKSVIIARPATPASPFRGGTYNYNYDYNPNSAQAFGFTTTTNRALLGVMSEKVDEGVKVTSVTKSSAAEKGGLKEGDVITKVDNTTITTPEELSKAIGKYKPEDKATITYKRDKKEQKATVMLEKRTDASSLHVDGLNNPNFNFDMMPGENGNWNLMARSNNMRLGLKAQDTEDGKGVKVLSVDEGSNAAKAGIKEGDVITEFDGDKISSVTDLMDAAKDMKDKSSIKVRLNRDGKTQEMDIRVPKRLKTATL